jgi:hypothetical protein
VIARTKAPLGVSAGGKGFPEMTKDAIVSAPLMWTARRPLSTPGLPRRARDRISSVILNAELARSHRRAVM